MSRTSGGTWRRSDGRLQRRDRRPRSWGSVVVRAGRDGDPVPLRSAVNLDSIESVSIAILTSRLGRLAETRVREICAALAVAVDCSG
jgi:mRNA-degrading endonuclease toxin of MazEF toxin-antitoxin module